MNDDLIQKQNNEEGNSLNNSADINNVNPNSTESLNNSFNQENNTLNPQENNTVSQANQSTNLNDSQPLITNENVSSDLLGNTNTLENNMNSNNKEIYTSNTQEENSNQDYSQNDSGKNENTKITSSPEGIFKWNWGAFFFTWLWGIFNGYFIPLYVFIGYVFLLIILSTIGVVTKYNGIYVINIILTFVFLVYISFLAYYLGHKGYQISWKNKKWIDLDSFYKTQKKWTIAGIIVAVLYFVITLVLIISSYSLVSTLSHYMQHSHTINVPMKTQSSVP